MIRVLFERDTELIALICISSIRTHVPAETPLNIKSSAACSGTHLNLAEEAADGGALQPRGFL